MAKISPTDSFILLELPKNSESRIVMPDNRNLKTIDVSSLIVIRVGPKCKNIRVGDRVIADIQAVAPFKYDNKQYFLTKEENVGCVIR